MLGIAAGCQKYELNTDFSMPVELDSPSNVILDVTSSKTVVLSWNGGGAADGGVLLYNVLFDKTGGDFSEPLATMPSDLGAKNTLTLTHAQLNTLARKAGVKPNETGSFIWTVTASRGGVTKTFDGYASLSVVRGEGIDNIPEHLYVAGSAALEAGQEFRMEKVSSSFTLSLEPARSSSLRRRTADLHSSLTRRENLLKVKAHTMSPTLLRQALPELPSTSTLSTSRLRKSART